MNPRINNEYPGHFDEVKSEVLSKLEDEGLNSSELRSEETVKAKIEEIGENGEVDLGDFSADDIYGDSIDDLENLANAVEEEEYDSADGYDGVDPLEESEE